MALSSPNSKYSVIIPEFLRLSLATIASGLVLAILGDLKMKWFLQAWYIAAPEYGFMEAFVILLCVMAVLLVFLVLS
jgi:hypothetical protein